jgi:tetratricopeptide (TPR) repeat protein
MRLFYPRLASFLAVLMIATLLSGCASRRFEKLALKNEQAGLFEDAAELYLQSLAANKNNIDAKIGAKKTGQIALDKKLSDFSTAYSAGQVHEAVFYYLNAKNYFDKFGANGVSLDFPSSYEEQFGEVKNISIEEKYRRAVKLLSDEKFAESEILFKEIIDLESNFKDVNDLFKTSHYEPLYRQGKKLFDNRTFRKAYYTFAMIVNETGDYKESAQYRNDALETATFTVLVREFDFKQDMKLASRIRSAMIGRMTNSENPFLKIIDESFGREMHFKQKKLINGSVNIQHQPIAKELTSNAILKGRVIQAGISNGRLNAVRKKGFLKRTHEVVDKVSGVTSTKIEYDKINYTEYNQSNAANCVFSFQLVSSETGEVLVSDEISLSGTDDMKYADYNGEFKNVYPGFWKSDKIKSSEDMVNTSYDDYSNLQRLFAAERTIMPAEQLMGDLIDQIALRSSGAVIRYNPEN